MKKLNKKGFSLVELIIVIAIMAVLIGVLAPTYLGHVKTAKISADLQNAQEISTSIAIKYATSASDAATAVSSWTEIKFKGETGAVCDVAKPAVQVESAYKWVYKYDGTNVLVGLSDGAASAQITQLYPSVTGDEDEKWTK